MVSMPVAMISSFQHGQLVLWPSGFFDSIAWLVFAMCEALEQYCQTCATCSFLQHLQPTHRGSRCSFLQPTHRGSSLRMTWTALAGYLMHPRPCPCAAVWALLEIAQWRPRLDVNGLPPARLQIRWFCGMPRFWEELWQRSMHASRHDGGRLLLKRVRLADSPWARRNLLVAEAGLPQWQAHQQ